MASDLFDQLAEGDVPPPPEHFDRQLHQRLNRTLLTMHIVDLCLRCLPWCLMKFGQAVIGAVRYTILGSYDAGHRRQSGKKRRK